MEYGYTLNNGEIHDSNFMRHVGYKQDNVCIKEYFSQENINFISNKITELTLGVDHMNRKIKVPDKNISSVMSAVMSSFRPPVGDIHSRYIVPSGISPESYVQQMINQVIQIITSDIKTSLGMEEYNKTLTAWTTLLGDFNEKGLRSHAPIKIQMKRPNPMEFNMNY